MSDQKAMSVNGLDPDEDLCFTQGIRKQIVAAFTQDTDLKELTNDPERASVLQRYLKDIDSVSIGLLRMRSNEDIANKEQEAKLAVLEVLARYDPSASKIPGAKNSGPKSVGEELGEREYVEGEKSVGLTSMTIDEFEANGITEDEEE